MEADDFMVGIELSIQNANGIELDNVGSWVLSDRTMQMIIEDVAEYLNEKEN